MRTDLLKLVNCESCDHYLYLTDREGDVRGTVCEHDYDTDTWQMVPLGELQCHSLYELWEEVQMDAED